MCPSPVPARASSAFPRAFAEHVHPSVANRALPGLPAACCPDYQCAVILPCCGIRSRACVRLTMRTSDVNRLRELPYPLAPGATPRIVKPDLARAIRRRTFLCAALYITLCGIYSRYTDSPCGARSAFSRRVQRPIRSR